MDQNDHDAPFWGHVAELRLVLIQSFFIILTAILLCLWFYQEIFSILTLPFDVDTLSAKNLVIFGPIDGMSITLKVCFWMGIVLSSPCWIYLILRFAAPAFEQREWQMVIPFISLSILFLGIGVGFAYFMTIPLAKQYLELFNASIGTNLWSLSHYVDFTLFLILANAMAFELSLILFFLVHFSIVSPETLASKRRYMIVLAFILGALLTPPDVLTQLMLAIPLIGLYELAVLYARFVQRAKKNKTLPLRREPK